jgi:hypothetical protein
MMAPATGIVQKKWTEPTAANLLLLPYVKAFFPRQKTANPEDSLVQALFEEYKVLGIVHNLRKAKRDLPSHVKERQEESLEGTTKAISKHFRRASVKVHPDQHGDLYEKEFNDLLDAYSVLRDPELRSKYVEDLLVVGARLGPEEHVLKRAHDTWEHNHRLLSQKDSERARYHQKAAGQQQQQQQQHAAPRYYLEGEIHTKQPRKIGVHRVHHKAKMAELTLDPLEPVYLFQEYCIAVYILIQGQDGSSKTLTFRKKHLQEAYYHFLQHYRFQVSFDDWGIYEVSWCADLGVDGKVVQTSHSVETEIDCAHPLYLQRLRDQPALLELARQRTGELASKLQHLKGHETHNRQQLEERYWALHRSAAFARDTAQRLATNLQFFDQDLDSCHIFTTLRDALNEAVTVKSELDAEISKNQKKDSLRAFKKSLAAMIEAGEAAEWIRTVSKDDIDNHGGEVNRLYQLLIEGKKANSLLLDAATLQNAAERTDLFSKKQCEVLSQRSSEIEALRVAETERLVQEAAEKGAAEKARKELEKQLAIVNLERGTPVMIKGLTNKPELNGSVGVYMGLGPNQRYIVRLWGSDGKEISLKQENFAEYKGPKLASVPRGTAAWQCRACTFFHEGLKSSATHCEMCGIPKGETSRPPTKKSAAAVATNRQPARPTTAPPGTSKKPAPAHSPARPTTTTASKKPAPGHNEAKVFVRKANVKSLIGKKGCNIKKISFDSGARLYVDDKQVDKDGRCVVTLSGSAEAVRRARVMVETFEEEQSRASASNQTHNGAASSKPTIAHSKPAAPQNVPSVPKPVPAPVPKVAPTPIAPPGLPSGPPPVMARPRPVNSSVGSMGFAEHSETHFLPVVESPSVQTSVVVSPVMESPVAFESIEPETKYSDVELLLQFLRTQQACLKCSPDELHRWLISQDVDSLATLLEAISDEDFMNEVQAHGVKGYKKAAFKRDLDAAFSKASQAGTTVDDRTAKYERALAEYLAAQGLSKERFHEIDSIDAPDELQCSISHALMVVDPVLAGDGHTYERHQIENWINTMLANGKPVTSPKTNQVLPDLSLTPNFSIRNMAREYVLMHTSSLPSRLI